MTMNKRTLKRVVILPALLLLLVGAARALATKNETTRTHAVLYKTLQTIQEENRQTEKEIGKLKKAIADLRARIENYEYVKKRNQDVIAHIRAGS